MGLSAPSVWGYYINKCKKLGEEFINRLGRKRTEVRMVLNGRERPHSIINKRKIKVRTYTGQTGDIQNNEHKQCRIFTDLK